MPATKAHGGKRERAGRPKIGRIPFAVRVKPEIAREIDRLCFHETKSRGQVIEERFT